MVKKDSSDQEASHQQKDGNKGEPCGSEVPFLELFNSTGTAMGLLDDDGLIIRSNDRFSELVDLPGDRIDGKVRWNEFVPDEDQVKVLKFHEMRPGSEDPPGEYDLLFKKYNGEIIHVHMNLSLIPDHNVWIFSIVDNEDSFRMEVELKEREKSLSDEVRKQHKIQGALFELATNPKILDVDLEDNIRTITKMISDLLDVERVSLWVLRNGRGSIECMDQYIRSEEKHSSGMRIRVKDHRHYIKALKDNPVIDINNGMLDDRTIEFAKGYVDVLNIYSMLDTGIWIRGELIGSLSIESVGVNRKWTMEEKRVAYEIADHVSVLFASDNKRKIESQIKELKEFNESLVNNMTDGIIIEGKDGHIKFTNPAMSKLVGSPAGFLRGSHWKDIVAPDYHGVVEEADLRREEGVSDSYGIELLRSDGSRVPALVSGIPNFQGGRYDGLMAIFTDIRELKNVQSELAVRSAYFQNLFENSPEAVILISNDGLIKRINKAFTTMFGYKEEECLGQMVDDFIVPTESKEYAVRLTMNSIKGMRMREDVLRKKKDGSLVDVSLTSSPIFTEDGQIGVYAIYRDISKEKGAERALMNERNRSEFYLDLLSHDIGNLHQGISTALQLSRIKGLDDKNGSIAFETAEELVQRSMHLVKNVIFLANIDTRQVKTKTIEVVSMMENTISHVVKLFQSKKISLELDLPGGPIHIVAEDIVEELFFNILHNGLKFQISDRVVIGVKIHEDRELGRVFIEMSDHGPGIPDDMKDLMFQRFEKGGALSHMGLGLSLVKALTNIYNGNIEVKDRIEGVREWGSKFIVDFPVANIQEGRIEAGDTSEKK